MSKTGRDNARQVVFSHNGDLYRGIIKYDGTLVKKDEDLTRPVVLGQDLSDAIMVAMGVQG